MDAVPPSRKERRVARRLSARRAADRPIRAVLRGGPIRFRGSPQGRPRSATVVIRKRDGGVIGS